MSEFSKSDLKYTIIEQAGGFKIQLQPYIIPIADYALVTWLIAHGVEEGKPMLVQFEFRHDKPGATYRGMPLGAVGE